MARQLGCSTALIYKRLAVENLKMHQKFCNISDFQLDEQVKALHTIHVNAGNQVCWCIHFCYSIIVLKYCKFLEVR
jgi:hypothetical protein